MFSCIFPMLNSFELSCLNVLCDGTSNRDYKNHRSSQKSSLSTLKKMKPKLYKRLSQLHLIWILVKFKNSLLMANIESLCFVTSFFFCLFIVSLLGFSSHLIKWFHVALVLFLYLIKYLYYLHFVLLDLAYKSDLTYIWLTFLMPYSCYIILVNNVAFVS